MLHPTWGILHAEFFHPRPMPKPLVSPQSSKTIEQQLSEILEHLRRMDKRDRLRTWGAFFRSILHLLPVAILLWSVWFTVYHWDDVLQQITKAAAEQSELLMKQGSGDIESGLQKQLEKWMPKKTNSPPQS